MNRIELLELVKQHHAHMGEVEILKLINRALDDFTTETGILKEYVDVQNTVAGQRYYTVDKCINIVNVWIDDILIPRIASVNTAMLIDDDEHVNADNALATPSSISYERYWYTIQDDGDIKIGLVEKSNQSVKRDDTISDYQSVSETGLQIRVYMMRRAVHLLAGSSSGSTYTPEIPSMYHEALTYKAIAQGYKDPRNQQIDAAQYFDNEYQISIKKAKKRARSNNVATGVIVPHSY